jgi:hypothetical protein
MMSSSFETSHIFLVSPLGLSQRLTAKTVNWPQSALTSCVSKSQRSLLATDDARLTTKAVRRLVRTDGASKITARTETAIRVTADLAPVAFSRPTARLGSCDPDTYGKIGRGGLTLLGRATNNFQLRCSNRMSSAASRREA